MSVADARRRAGGVVLKTLFERGSAALSRHPRAKPELHGLEVVRDVAYLDTGLSEHRLDVWRPTVRQGPLPVIFYVHGGAFRILSKESHWMVALRFARQGAIVFLVNYRLAPKSPFPAAIEDVAAAWRWVAAHAAEYGGDLDRLVFGGESAGANLVCGLTVASCWRRPEPWAQTVWDLDRVPRGVHAVYGVYQVSDIERLWRDRPMHWFFRDRLTEMATGYLPASAGGPGAEMADPVVVIEGSAPERPLPRWYLPVGTKDPVYADTVRLEAALRARGAEVRASYFQGEGHVFDMLRWKAAAKVCWAEKLEETRKWVGS